MHMMSVRIDFGVMDHRRDRRERSFSRSTRVVCLQSSLALDQRRASKADTSMDKFDSTCRTTMRRDPWSRSTWWSTTSRDTKYLGRRLRSAARAPQYVIAYNTLYLANLHRHI